MPSINHAECRGANNTLLYSQKSTFSNLGWVEWMYHKVNLKNLKKHVMATANVSTASVSSATPPLPESVVDYLIW
jgi:hypothetical protein